MEEAFRQSKAFRSATVRTSQDVDDLVLKLLQGRDFAFLQTMYDLAAISPRVRDQAIVAWRKSNKPPLAEFFPYSYLILRIELYFLIGLANGIITTRDSNRIDIEYLKYLPFTQVFTSADDLHIQSSKHFLGKHNAFISGADLKKSLIEIADHWDALDEEKKKRGTASYADFPPTALDNGVTQLYDRYIPGWRENANKPRPKISQEENDRIMTEIRSKMEEIKAQRRATGRFDSE